MQTPAQDHAQKKQQRKQRGASRLALLTMVAIVCVVIFVSVPRLRSFALSENESDARITVAILARQLARLSVAGDPSEGPLLPQLSKTPSVKQALSDGEFLEGGMLLRRHGFLFRILRVDRATGQPKRAPGTVLADSKSTYAIQAWPWRHGRTGSAALLATENGLIFRHENRAAKWNGPVQERGDLMSWQGWSLLP